MFGKACRLVISKKINYSLHVACFQTKLHHFEKMCSVIKIFTSYLLTKYLAILFSFNRLVLILKWPLLLVFKHILTMVNSF